MADGRVALYIAVLVVAIAVVFVGYMEHLGSFDRAPGEMGLGLLLLRLLHRRAAGEEGVMSGHGLAAYVAGVAIATAVLFVAYASSGADLCLWCPVLGQ